MYSVHAQKHACILHAYLHAYVFLPAPSLSEIPMQTTGSYACPQSVASTHAQAPGFRQGLSFDSVVAGKPKAKSILKLNLRPG